MSPEDACQQLGVCRGKTKDDLDALTDGIDKAADFADTVAVTSVETLLDPTTLNPGVKAMKMVGKGVGKILGHTDEMRGATRGEDAAGGAARAGAQLTGQIHHAILRTVHKALEAHPNLKGVYGARDPRFVTQAKDLASHRGYDTFHRNLDAEVAGWVRGNPNATQAQFESYLRGVYQRPDVSALFPNGL